MEQLWKAFHNCSDDTHRPLHASTVQTIIAEIGLDMGKWPNAKAFCAWLGLAPRHEISGGNVLRRVTLQTRNHAGQALRFAAQAAGRSQSGLGAFYRRMRARLGPQSAIVAAACRRFAAQPWSAFALLGISPDN